MAKDFSPKYYVLLGKLVVPEKNWMVWASKFEDTDARRVAFTQIGSVAVSTVFIGLDHNFSGDGPPHVFETLVSRAGVGSVEDRCGSWQEAEEMHQRIVDEVRAEVLPFLPPRVVK